MSELCKVQVNQMIYSNQTNKKANEEKSKTKTVEMPVGKKKPNKMRAIIGTCTDFARLSAACNPINLPELFYLW